MEEDPVAITEYTSLPLDLRPDVVKFWPRNDRYGVVGTYTLLEDAPSEPSQEKEEPGEEKGVSELQTRVGSLNLIRVQNGNIEIIHTLPTPFGVYDLHFADHHGLVDDDDAPDVFLVGTSTGSIAVYRIVATGRGDEDRDPEIMHVRTLQLLSKNILVTSLALHPDGRHVAMTLSHGRVCVLDLRARVVASCMQHEFQAWHCAFVELGGGRGEWGIVSGGDDATLRYTGVELGGESGFEVEATRTMMPWVERKIHQAGVTAVLPLSQPSDSPSPLPGFLVITGSYDDHIRLLHCPPSGRRHVLAEAYIGGGVFRVKLAATSTTDAAQTHTLIVSCMQAGARIVSLCHTGDEWHFSIAASFEQNAGTLLYASDCQAERDAAGRRTIVSTSFEDRKVYLWKA